jgi:hypothetical protein
MRELGGRVISLSSRVLYRKAHPEYTSENTRNPEGEPLAIDVVATDVTIKFPGTRCEMLRRLRGIGIKSEDIGGPFREDGLERCTYFQAPCQDSGIHQTGVAILCQPAKF